MDDKTVYATPAARYLVVMRGPGQGRMYLILEGATGIGRAPDNAVVLDARDVRASRHHAVVRVEGSLVVVEDLGSANGTLLDGQPVSKAELRPGQELCVGDTVFVLTSPDAQAAASGPAGREDADPLESAPAAPVKPPRSRALLYGALLALALGVLALAVLGGGDKPAEQAEAPSPAPVASAPAPAAPAAPEPQAPPAGEDPAAKPAGQSQELTRLGNFLYNSGKIKKAVEHWREAVKLDPSNTQASRMLVRAESELDQLVDKHYRQAQLALRYQRLDEARAELLQVVENSLNPGDERTMDSQKKLEELGGR